MFNSTQFEKLTEALYAALPTSLQDIEKDVQQKFKAILQATFAHMDLVTREEFDVQTKVLARTREKVEALKLQIEALERQFNQRE